MKTPKVLISKEWWDRYFKKNTDNINSAFDNYSKNKEKELLKKEKK